MVKIMTTEKFDLFGQKLCDICIVEDGVATWANRKGKAYGMSVGESIAICENHRNRFRELDSTRMREIIQESQAKVRSVLKATTDPITQ
tara:strand:+ start:463 stop:729 length:267 start_codon:yes stop_codon:yes gene_type:complete